ncbi:hypothetical protein LCGC14_1470000 [marine sediment metagenome]|uniref:Uncharacterized protein n=1 Tax=marine sediment metagenome TaxID=412755 RepID=A0A0F9JD84_9ZZZZ
MTDETEKLVELIKWLRTVREDLTKIKDTKNGEGGEYNFYDSWNEAHNGIQGMIKQLKIVIGDELCKVPQK